MGHCKTGTTTNPWLAIEKYQSWAWQFFRCPLALQHRSCCIGIAVVRSDNIILSSRRLRLLVPPVPALHVILTERGEFLAFAKTALLAFTSHLVQRFTFGLSHTLLLIVTLIIWYLPNVSSTETSMGAFAQTLVHLLHLLRSWFKSRASGMLFTRVFAQHLPLILYSVVSQLVVKNAGNVHQTVRNKCFP